MLKTDAVNAIHQPLNEILEDTLYYGRSPSRHFPVFQPPYRSRRSFAKLVGQRCQLKVRTSTKSNSERQIVSAFDFSKGAIKVSFTPKTASDAMYSSSPENVCVTKGS